MTSWSPSQDQLWAAVLAAARQDDLALFKQALRAARPLLSDSRLMTTEHRIQLWQEALAHPDLAWHRAALKTTPLETRAPVLLATPMELWNHPRWLKEMWGLVVPDRLVQAVARALDSERLPAIARVRAPDKTACRVTQGWVHGLLVNAIENQDVARMRDLWPWTTPGDDHWRAIAGRATKEMLAWLMELRRAEGAKAVPLNKLALEACRVRQVAASSVISWCATLLSQGRAASAYPPMFANWVQNALSANNEGVLNTLENHLPPTLSVQTLVRLCQYNDVERVGRWLPGHAPAAGQVFTDLTSLGSPWWRILDQIGEVWPDPGELGAWVKEHGDHLPRSLARYRASQPSPPTPTASRPRRRV